MNTILLKFAGPLQSWGVGSNYETRYTERFPSKSGVIGLISACLGYKRDEDEKIRELNSLDFAVRVDRSGSILRDYQIATKYKKTGISAGEMERTYVTNRYYLQDAVFIVGIGSEDKDIIDKIEKALKSPYYQPFLGKRSLPLNADFFLGITDKDVISSLKDEQWHGQNINKNKYNKIKEICLDIYADGDLLDSPKREIKRENVISFSQKNRRHGFRVIANTQVKLKLKNTSDHDAFSALEV